MSEDIYKIAEPYLAERKSVWATADGNIFFDYTDARKHGVKLNIEFFEVTKKTSKEK